MNGPSALFDPLRYQIREHKRVPLGDGERHEYGIVLWDGDDVADDSSAGIAKVLELTEDGRDVALGIVSVTDPNGPFQAVYFARPHRDLPPLRVLPRLGDSRHLPPPSIAGFQADRVDRHYRRVFQKDGVR